MLENPIPDTQTNPVTGEVAQPNPSPVPPTTNPVPASANINPQSDTEKALKHVHTTGTWSLVLGCLVVAVVPILSLALYAMSKSNDNPNLTVAKSNLTEVLAVSVVLGLIQGGILIWMGLKLKKVDTQTLATSDKLLVRLMIYLIILAVLGLITSGRGFGILNIILFVDAMRAHNDIKSLGQATPTQSAQV